MHTYEYRSIYVIVNVSYVQWDIAQAVEHSPVKVGIICTNLQGGCICSLSYFPFQGPQLVHKRLYYMLFCL